MSAQIQYVEIPKSEGEHIVPSPPSKPVGGYLHGNAIRLTFQSDGESLSDKTYIVVENEGNVTSPQNTSTRYITSVYQGNTGYHVFLVVSNE